MRNRVHEISQPQDLARKNTQKASAGENLSNRQSASLAFTQLLAVGLFNDGRQSRRTTPC
jgi:hypothetical protein